MRLDHVALATRDATPSLQVLVGELGGTVFGGGNALGYRPMQVYLGDAAAGMKVELLEPWQTEANDFLERFIVRHGEGPHHLTFKVDDLAAAIARVEDAGVALTGVDLSMPIWKEAFIAPRDAHGTVVQLAESSQPYDTAVEEYAYVLAHGSEGVPAWWSAPPPSRGPVTFLRRVVMTTPALATARAFFTGLLDGTETDAGGGFVELTWPGGGCLRLEEHADRAPGVDRLELEGPGAPRELVLAGTRLLVRPAP
jgi:catechol 2,3-dioxygenase-like lactoylglutathione lyase family enzyme